MLKNGEWTQDWDPYQATNDDGEFLRQISEFRSWITPDGRAGRTGQSGFKAEPNRYHLYISYVCPWACRTLMVRSLKRLDHLISVSVVRPFLTDEGWSFGAYPGSTPEPFYGDQYLHQLYTRVAPSYNGRATVPVLWDKKHNTIVNNESADIIEMLNSGFGDLADQSIDLRPKKHLSKIKALNETIYTGINNGVYKAGFAQTQHAYEAAYRELFDTLDEMEANLRFSRYLLGEELTEPDIRLFVTLIRFDAVYFSLFKCNKKRIQDYPALSRFMEDIYSLPGIEDTVNMQHIKTGYYSVKALNPQKIVPLGPEDNFWQTKSKTITPFVKPVVSGAQP